MKKKLETKTFYFSYCGIDVDTELYIHDCNGSPVTFYTMDEEEVIIEPHKIKKVTVLEDHRGDFCAIVRVAYQQ